MRLPASEHDAFARELQTALAVGRPSLPPSESPAARVFSLRSLTMSDSVWTARWALEKLKALGAQTITL